MEDCQRQDAQADTEGHTTDNQVECALALAQHGIWPLYYWIVGFPTETQADINETLDQADRMYRIHQGKLTQNFYAYTALPGSPLFELVDKDKLQSQWKNGATTVSIKPTTSKPATYITLVITFPSCKVTRQIETSWLEESHDLPFETLATLRWKFRVFGGFDVEKFVIEKLLRDASKRYERRAGSKVKDADIMDWE